MAERVGFEPTVGLTLRLISSQVHSTTLPPLRTKANYSFGVVLWFLLRLALILLGHPSRVAMP